MYVADAKGPRKLFETVVNAAGDAYSPSLRLPEAVPRIEIAIPRSRPRGAPRDGTDARFRIGLDRERTPFANRR